MFKVTGERFATLAFQLIDYLIMQTVLPALPEFEFVMSDEIHPYTRQRVPNGTSLEAKTRRGSRCFVRPGCLNEHQESKA